MARLLEKYRSEIVPKMKEQFKYSNVHAVPRLEKITVSMGVGKAVENAKRMEAAAKEIASITGQKPLVSRAKKSISGFHLRQGVSIGCKVTLRGRRMYEFFDRLISLVIPRIRDFRGFPAKAFDGRGNYSLGLTEQIVFPEISIDDVEFVQGMNIAITIKSSSDEESLALLEHFGFPFRR
ncbi:MAG: 50S ribosomal protein L5 [Planctomycetes bacterium]|nr:50S ribosomal protein L5 [Planctomycetota bacterium]